MRMNRTLKSPSKSPQKWGEKQASKMTLAVVKIRSLLKDAPRAERDVFFTPPKGVKYTFWARKGDSRVRVNRSRNSTIGNLINYVGQTPLFFTFWRNSSRNSKTPIT